jgi:hypothetical protein
MFCSSCGSQLVAGASHCGSCGASVVAAGSPQPSPTLGLAGYQSQLTPSYQGQTDFGGQPIYNSQQIYNAPASGKAIASLVLSILGISLIGLILGYVARTEIRQSAGRLSGDGMAIAGIILGWLGTIVWTLLWIIIIVAVAMSDSYFY